MMLHAVAGIRYVGMVLRLPDEKYFIAQPYIDIEAEGKGELIAYVIGLYLKSGWWVKHKPERVILGQKFLVKQRTMERDEKRVWRELYGVGKKLRDIFDEHLNADLLISFDE